MLFTRGMTKSVLHSVPRYVEASLWTHPAVANQTFVVLANRLLKPTDLHMLGPVHDYLASVCAREDDWEMVKIPGWVCGGRCTRTEYSIYAECPGDASTHLCRHERINAERRV